MKNTDTIYNTEASRYWQGKTRNELLEMLVVSLGEQATNLVSFLSSNSDIINGRALTDFGVGEADDATAMRLFYNIYKTLGLDSVLSEEDFRLHFDMIQAWRFVFTDYNCEKESDEPLEMGMFVRPEFVFGK